MKKLVVVFLVFSFFLSILYADDFHVSQDYEDSEVFVTTFFSVEDVGAGGFFYDIEYDKNSVVGLNHDEVFWEELVDLVGGRYRRVAGVRDFVRVPAGSKVKISSIVKNESGHDVVLKDFHLFLSRQDHTLGNIDIFQEVSGNGIYNYLFFGNEAFRQGQFVFLPSVFNVLNDETKVFDLHTVEILQPLHIQSLEWSIHILDNGELKIDVALLVRNIANFSLENIEFFHLDYYEKRTFQPLETYIYEYSVNFGRDYNYGFNSLKSFEIVNNTNKLECAVLGTSEGVDISGDSKSLIFSRSDVGEGWFGETSDIDWYPENLGMCIELMDYKLVGKNIEFNISANVDVVFLSEGRALEFGDDFAVSLNIENRGFDLEFFDVVLDFDGNLQRVKSSNCKYFVVERGLVLRVVDFKGMENVFCEIVFEVLQKDKFSFLETSVHKDEKILFKYAPDIEMSLEYVDDDFVFESSVKEGGVLELESFREGRFCKKVLFWGLEDEVCI